MPKKKPKPKDRTTPKQFELFKKEATQLINRLGIGEQEIQFLHKRIQAKAEIEFHHDNKAVLILSTTFHGDEATDTDVVLAAKHEVTHLLLRRLYQSAYDRFATKDQIDRAEHDIVYRLEKVL